MLTIFGYSDDNVEIRGGLTNAHALDEEDQRAGTVALKPGAEDEIACYDADVEFTIGGSFVVRMDYVDPGVWSALLRQTDEDVQIPWPVRVVNGEGGYSVAVEIDCPDGTPITYRVLKRAPVTEWRERAERAEKANGELRKRNAELTALEVSVAKAMKATR